MNSEARSMTIDSWWYKTPALRLELLQLAALMRVMIKDGEGEQKEKIPTPYKTNFRRYKRKLL